MTASLLDDGAVRLSASADARTGDGSLRIYAPGKPIEPAQKIPLNILPGPAPRLEKQQRATMSPGAGYAGALAMGGEMALEFSLKGDRRMSFDARGDADLSITLETSDGALLGADDDSGDGLDSRLTANLSSGAYVIRISHCCGGGGAFTLTTTSE
ncbi:MAG: hypothetical protein AAF401_18300 [Pseudomonadota bacterium]